MLPLAVKAAIAASIRLFLSGRSADRRPRHRPWSDLVDRGRPGVDSALCQTESTTGFGTRTHASGLLTVRLSAVALLTEAPNQ